MGLIISFQNFISRHFSLVLAILLVLLIVIALFKMDFGGSSTPCDPQSLQMACYYVTPKICKKTWDALEVKCHDLLPKVMGREFSPSEIIAPKIAKCQKVFFDKQFHNSRKIEGGSGCDDLFLYIEERRHDFDE